MGWNSQHLLHAVSALVWSWVHHFSNLETEFSNCGGKEQDDLYIERASVLDSRMIYQHLHLNATFLVFLMFLNTRNSWLPVGHLIYKKFTLT